MQPKKTALAFYGWKGGFKDFNLLGNIKTTKLSTCREEKRLEDDSLINNCDKKCMEKLTSLCLGVYISPALCETNDNQDFWY